VARASGSPCPCLEPVQQAPQRDAEPFLADRPDVPGWRREAGGDHRVLRPHVDSPYEVNAALREVFATSNGQ
jgi:hypothetical protein